MPAWDSQFDMKFSAMRCQPNWLQKGSVRLPIANLGDLNTQLRGTRGIATQCFQRCTSYEHILYRMGKRGKLSL